MQGIKRHISGSELLYWAVICLLISIAKAEYFTVLRGYTENGSNKPEDIITLPPASRWCSENFTKCSDFNANAFPNKPCSCVCPLERNTIQRYDNKWACTQNSKIRKHGCVYSFYKEELGNPNASLMVADGSFFKYLYPFRKPQNWNCRLAPRMEVYQPCNGEWKSLPVASALFKIFVPHGVEYYAFKVNGTNWSQYPDLNGKVIKLFLKCTNSSSVTSQGCLLFKLKGSFNCTITTATVPTVVTAAVSTSRFRASSGNVTSPTVTPATNHKGNNSISTVKIIHNPSTSIPLTVLVAGVVSAVVFFLLLTSIVLFIVRRKKSTRNAESQNSHSDDDVQYCDPTKTCATVQPGLSSKLGPTELLPQREDRSAYQSLKKDLSPNIGDYQSLVKVPENDDGYIYSAPYCVTRLTSKHAKDCENNLQNSESSNDERTKASCFKSRHCQQKNGYEIPIDSQTPDYIDII